MIDVQCNEDVGCDWDSRLQLCSGGTIFHTRAFARFNIKAFDAQSKFLTFVDSKGEIVAQNLCHIVKPVSFKRRLYRYFRQKPARLCRWVYGPVIFNKDLALDVEKALSDFLMRQKTPVDATGHPFFPSAFKSSGTLNITPWATFILDLTRGEEELLASTRKNSVKKNIARSIQRGVTVEKITSENMPDYISIRNKSESKDDLHKLRIQWDELQSTGYHGFLAYKDGEPVGGIAFSSFNQYINEWGIARSRRDKQDNLYSQDLLKWNIIKWGIKNNCRFYDLSGVNPNPANEQERGIYRYKSKWGGKLFHYSKISNSPS